MLPPSVRILVCTQSQDMRRSFDRLAEVARSFMREEPQNGTLFVFVSRRSNRVKVLWWDRNGFCILYKRLHHALFVAPVGTRGVPSVKIDSSALAQLLAGVARAEERRTARLH